MKKNLLVVFFGMASGVVLPATTDASLRAAIEQCVRGVISAWSTRVVFSYDELSDDCFTVRYNGLYFIIISDVSNEQLIASTVKAMNIVDLCVMADMKRKRMWRATYDLVAQQEKKEREQRERQKARQLAVNPVAVSVPGAVRDISSLDDAELFAHVIVNRANCFACLGLANFADDRLVKDRFRRLALRTHPVKNDAPNAQQVFSLLKVAHDTAIALNKKKAGF